MISVLPREGLDALGRGGRDLLPPSPGLAPPPWGARGPASRGGASSLHAHVGEHSRQPLGLLFLHKRKAGGVLGVHFLQVQTERLCGQGRSGVRWETPSWRGVLSGFPGFLLSGGAGTREPVLSRRR